MLTPSERPQLMRPGCVEWPRLWGSGGDVIIRDTSLDTLRAINHG